MQSGGQLRFRRSIAANALITLAADFRLPQTRVTASIYLVVCINNVLTLSPAEVDRILVSTPIVYLIGHHSGRTVPIDI
jgi:hypothetical protein